MVSGTLSECLCLVHGYLFEELGCKTDETLNGVLFWAFIIWTGVQEILLVSQRETNVSWKIPRGKEGIIGNASIYTGKSKSDKRKESKVPLHFSEVSQDKSEWQNGHAS